MRTRIINLEDMLDKKGPGSIFKTIYVPEDECDASLLRRCAENEINTAWDIWMERFNLRIDVDFTPRYVKLDEGVALITIHKVPKEFEFSFSPMYTILAVIEKTTDTHQVWWFVPADAPLVDGLNEMTRESGLRRYGNSHPPDNLFDFEGGVILPSH